MKPKLTYIEGYKRKLGPYEEPYPPKQRRRGMGAKEKPAKYKLRWNGILSRYQVVESVGNKPVHVIHTDLKKEFVSRCDYCRESKILSSLFFSEKANLTSCILIRCTMCGARFTCSRKNNEKKEYLSAKKIAHVAGVRKFLKDIMEEHTLDIPVE